MIPSVFNLSVDKCPLCNDQGLVPVKGKDNVMEECTCLIVAKLKAYAGEFQRFDMLTGTKLLGPLKSRQSIIIECEDPRVAGAHIKSALILRKDITKSWKMVYPNELMELHFSAMANKLYEPDLLIINAPAFPFYEKAAIQHEYVISTRNGRNTPTWIIVRSLKSVLENKNYNLTPSFVQQLKNFPIIKLSYLETQSLTKRSKKPSICLNQGVGVSGLSETALVIQPEIESRIKIIQGRLHERRASATAVSDNGDDAES
jgi:hypothetical protein